MPAVARVCFQGSWVVLHCACQMEHAARRYLADRQCPRKIPNGREAESSLPAGLYGHRASPETLPEPGTSLPKECRGDQ
jgi:hypothetical protein